MYSNNYLRTNLKLIKSLVVLFHSEAVNVNMFLLKKYGSSYVYEENDIRTWKHYLNLCGDFHTLDHLLYPDGLKVNYNDTEYKLDKITISNNSLLREELLKFDILYRSVLDDYPDMETYIKGVILPSDINTLISLKDGSIINFDKTLIEPNETSLLYELQDFIYRFKDRWLVNEYVLVDEYYISSFLGNLTSSLIIKLFNIRLSKIGTEEVHSYLMNEFFKSNLELYLNVDSLNNDIRLYLYKNLKYLIKHTGKEETLELIIDNILTPSGVLVKEILKKQRTVDENLTYSSNKLYIETYNKSDYNESPISYRNVYNLELIEENLEDKVVSRDIFFNMIDRSTLTKERTKLLLLDYIAGTRIKPVNEAKVLYEIWLYRVFKKDINSSFTFIDPNTKIEYILDEKTSLYIITKGLLKLIDKADIKFKDFALSSIPSESFSDENLLSNSDIVDKVQNYLNSNPLNYETKEVFKKIIDLNNLFWIYINDDYNPSIRSDGDLIYERLHSPAIINFSSEYSSIDDKFIDPITYTTNYDVRKTIVSLVYQFTGYDIDRKSTIDMLLNNFKDIVNKLTSYTTQVRTLNNYSNLYLTNSLNGVIVGPDLLTISNDSFVVIEPLDYKVEIEARNINNNVSILDRGIGKVSFVKNSPYRLNMNVMNTDLYEVPISSEIHMRNSNDKHLNRNFTYTLPGNF